MTTLTNIWNDFAHLFFPHLCAGCGIDNLGLESPLCIHCMNQLPVTNFHLYADNPVEKYFWGRIPIASATSLYHFTSGSLNQHLLHQLKYNSHKDAGYFLGRMMGKALQASDRFQDVDALVPLPLYAEREK